MFPYDSHDGPAKHGLIKSHRKHLAGSPGRLSKGIANQFQKCHHAFFIRSSTSPAKEPQFLEHLRLPLEKLSLRIFQRGHSVSKCHSSDATVNTSPS
jgi:hypothetical protein